MSAPESRAGALLYELCVTYGYCLSESVTEQLLADPPDDPDRFVDAVLVAEGLDPLHVDRHVREELLGVVRDWLFDDGRGRGTRSGLPRLRSTT